MKLFLKPLAAFEPYLAPNESFTPETLFPPSKQQTGEYKKYYASKKLDGIRCIVKQGEVLSRSLKRLPNRELPTMLHNLVLLTRRNKNLVFDGEIYSSFKKFSEISSVVMAHHRPIPSDFKFCCFDLYNEENPYASFSERLALLQKTFLDPENKLLGDKRFCIIPQQTLPTYKALVTKFGIEVQTGGEGLILKHRDAPYKFGRATVQEATTFKLKPWETFDAEIVEVLQGTKVDPDAQKETDELGRSKTSRKIADRIPIPAASAFLVNYKDKQVKVSLSSTTHSMREHFWINKNKLIGEMIEYKGTRVGAKDVPRHPVFIRFRKDKTL